MFVLVVVAETIAHLGVMLLYVGCVCVDVILGGGGGSGAYAYSAVGGCGGGPVGCAGGNNGGNLGGGGGTQFAGGSTMNPPNSVAGSQLNGGAG